MSMGGLRRFNAVMALVHAAQAIIVWRLSTDFIVPITGSYLHYDQASQSLIPASKPLFEFNFIWLIVGFFAASAIAHGLAATVLHKSYESNLQKGLNRIRWFEYAFGAGLMMVAVAVLVGDYDASSLKMVFGLTAVMCLMGLVMELYNQGKKTIRWLPYWIGVLAGIIPWIVVAIYLRLSAGEGSGPPTFVYFIFVSIFILYCSFAINMLLHYRQVGRWKDYLYTERMYIYLSLIAKSALAWQIFAGSLRP